MEHLNGPFLFDSMYAEDVEGSQLSHLPGVGELVQTYPSRSQPPPGPGRGSPGGAPLPARASRTRSAVSAGTHGYLVSRAQAGRDGGWLTVSVTLTLITLFVGSCRALCMQHLKLLQPPHGVGAILDPNYLLVAGEAELGEGELSRLCS